MLYEDIALERVKNESQITVCYPTRLRGRGEGWWMQDGKKDSFTKDPVGPARYKIIFF